MAERKRLKRTQQAGRLKPVYFGDRIIQADVVKLIRKTFQVPYTTALYYLRNYGPEPVVKVNSHRVLFKKSEIDEWLAQSQRKERQSCR